MAEERSEKQTIRSLWVEEVKSVAEHYPDSDVPWYLTLSGSEGKDIKLLIKEGLISLTEVNSIVEKDQHKIVAVENNNIAIAKLQRQFMGLKIKEVDFRSLIRGDSTFHWPQGQDEKYCRAHVVNLDLNDPLQGTKENDSINFPVLSWIRKLCQLHEKSPRKDWTLCLTLHGEIVWPDEVNEWIKQFLAENLNRECAFAQSCREFLGDVLFSQVTNCATVDFTTLDRAGQQKIIMIMVPKIITNLVHNTGWHVLTERNLRYGEDEEHAPMVTWIVKFTWSGQASAQPDALYRSALRDIFTGAGIVTDSGEIEQQSIER